MADAGLGHKFARISGRRIFDIFLGNDLNRSGDVFCGFRNPGCGDNHLFQHGIGAFFIAGFLFRVRGGFVLVRMGCGSDYVRHDQRIAE